MKRLWLKDPLKKDNKDGQKRLNHKNMTTYPDIPFFLLWEKGLHMFGYARECQFYTVVPYIHTYVLYSYSNLVSSSYKLVKY